MGAHPGRLLHGLAPGRRLRRGLRVLGRGPGCDPHATTTTSGSSAGCSTSRRRSNGSRSSAPNACSGCAPRPRPIRGAPTRQAFPPDLDEPGQRVGARRGVGRALPRRARRRARRRRGARRRGRREPLRVARRAARAATPARGVQLTAEIGLWGYDATPADPFVLNHRNFPTATMLGDAAMVLGALVGGAGTTTIGCLGGAQVDRFGNVNSTRIEPRPFLVGSGGGNDVASTATENVVVATLTPQRTPADCSYITSPGRAVRALVTDLGLLEKQGDLAIVRAGAHRGARPATRRSPIASPRRGRRAVGISRSRPTSPSSRRRPPTRSRRCGAGIRAAGSCGRASFPRRWISSCTRGTATSRGATTSGRSASSSAEQARAVRRARLLRRAATRSTRRRCAARRRARARRRPGEAVPRAGARRPVQRRGARHADGRAARGDPFRVRPASSAPTSSLAALARDLVGPDVRLYWDQSVYKQPNSAEPVLWHQDNGYTYVEPQAYLTCWIAITDATPDNGCIAVMPGIHRGAPSRTGRPPIGEECWGDWSAAVEVPVAAGQHRGVQLADAARDEGRTSTDAVRKAYIVQYAPDGAVALHGDPGRARRRNGSRSATTNAATRSSATASVSKSLHPPPDVVDEPAGTGRMSRRLLALVAGIALAAVGRVRGCVHARLRAEQRRRQLLPPGDRPRARARVRGHPALRLRPRHRDPPAALSGRRRNRVPALRHARRRRPGREHVRGAGAVGARRAARHPHRRHTGRPGRRPRARAVPDPSSPTTRPCSRSRSRCSSPSPASCSCSTGGPCSRRARSACSCSTAPARSGSSSCSADGCSGDSAGGIACASSSWRWPWSHRGSCGMP